MAWLPQGEKNFDDIFIRFGVNHERDGRTDGQTPGDGNSRAMHSIARQKSYSVRNELGYTRTNTRNQRKNSNYIHVNKIAYICMYKIYIKYKNI